MSEGTKVLLIATGVIGTAVLLFWQLRRVQDSAWAEADQSTEPFLQSVRDGAPAMEYTTAAFRESCPETSVQDAQARREERYGTMLGWKRHTASEYFQGGGHHYRLEYVLQYENANVTMAFEVVSTDEGPRIRRAGRIGARNLEGPDC